MPAEAILAPGGLIRASLYLELTESGVGGLVRWRLLGVDHIRS